MKFNDKVNVKEEIFVRHMKAGYIMRRVIIDGSSYKCPDTGMTMCYNMQGDYIGDAKTARFLCGTKGIAPELREPTHNTCSIGFSKQDNQWYGWSHRAICGFSNKQDAINFADSVS